MHSHTDKLDVRGSVHHSAIHKEIQQDAKMYQNFIIPHLYEAKHVSGKTPPIIRSLKLHWHPLGFHTWKDVGRVVGGRCQARHIQHPSTYENPEDANAVLGS
jgi:hypothetical protein